MKHGHPKIDAGSGLRAILAKLSQAAIINDGRVSWKSHELDEGTFDIIYALHFSPPVDDYIKDGAIWSALNECARNGDFSPTFFLRKVRIFIIEKHAVQPEPFTGICQINYPTHFKLPKALQTVGGKVEFRQRTSHADSAALEKLSLYKRNRLGLQESFGFAFATVRSADERSAINTAYRDIKFGLGVLNLVCRGYGISKRFGLPNAPIGTVLSVSSLFLISRKKRTVGHYSFESYYPSLYRTHFSVRQTLENATASARHYVSDLRRIDFSDKLVQAVILLQEGLEANEIDAALLKFWIGIEILCSKESRETTDKIIQRASSVFLNPDHAERRLRFIHSFRNKIVHRGDSGDHALLCAQWGSIYLAEIIRFCLFNRYKLRAHEDILSFMSVPADVSKLEETLSIYKMRLRSIRSKLPRDAA